MLQVGNEVKLLSTRFPSSAINPVWATSHIIGKVIEVRETHPSIHVRWANGRTNVYFTSELGIPDCPLCNLTIYIQNSLQRSLVLEVLASSGFIVPTPFLSFPFFLHTLNAKRVRAYSHLSSTPQIHLSEDVISVSTFTSRFTPQKPMPISLKKKKKIKTIHIQVERKQNSLRLTIEIPPELEAFFKEISRGKAQTSTVWKDEQGNGSSFYLLSTAYKETIARVLSGKLPFFDHYGDGLLQGDAINLAPLRTVGAGKSDGVVLTSKKFGAVSNVGFQFYAQSLAEAVKELWQECLGDKKLRATITVEI